MTSSCCSYILLIMICNRISALDKMMAKKRMVTFQPQRSLTVLIIAGPTENPRFVITIQMLNCVADTFIQQNFVPLVLEPHISPFTRTCSSRGILPLVLPFMAIHAGILKWMIPCGMPLAMYSAEKLK